MKAFALAVGVAAAAAVQPSSVTIAKRAGGSEVDNCSFDGLLGLCLSTCPKSAAQKAGICPLAADICCVASTPSTPAPVQPTPPPAPPTPSPPPTPPQPGPVVKCSFDGKLGYCESTCPKSDDQKPGICPVGTDICCVTAGPPAPPGVPTPPPTPPPPIKGKRLVPTDGSVLHCAGQMNDGMTITDQIPYPGNFTGFTGYNGTNECGGPCDPHKTNCGLCSGYGCCGGFTPYSAYLKPETRPSVFMAYFAPTWPVDRYEPWFKNLKALFSRYPDDHYFGYQLALWTTGEDDSIVNGTWDKQIDLLIAGFKSVGRPVWLRIGYEYNGPWNKHSPEAYRNSWIHITKKLRADPWCNKYVATVFDYTADAPYPLAEMPNAWAYYPGDEWVDWAGVNIFSGCAGPDSTEVAQFIDNATARGLPIMFGESTPRQAAGSWEWYEGYFGLVKKSPNVRAFCYINWNWFPTNWGDARIEASGVGPKYQEVMSDASYNFFHATTEEETLKKLGL